MKTIIFSVLFIFFISLIPSPQVTAYIKQDNDCLAAPTILNGYKIEVFDDLVELAITMVPNFTIPVTRDQFINMDKKRQEKIIYFLLFYLGPAKKTPVTHFSEKAYKKIGKKVQKTDNIIIEKPLIRHDLSNTEAVFLKKIKIARYQCSKSVSVIMPMPGETEIDTLEMKLEVITEEKKSVAEKKLKITFYFKDEEQVMFLESSCLSDDNVLTGNNFFEHYFLNDKNFLHYGIKEGAVNRRMRSNLIIAHIFRCQKINIEYIADEDFSITAYKTSLVYDDSIVLNKSA